MRKEPKKPVRTQRIGAATRPLDEAFAVLRRRLKTGATRIADKDAASRVQARAVLWFLRETLGDEAVVMTRPLARLAQVSEAGNTRTTTTKCCLR
jgi:hypothetical protein